MLTPPEDEAWLALSDSRVMLFGRPWLRSMSRWPDVSIQLTARFAGAIGRSAREPAIRECPGVEERVLATLGYLGERWGRPERDGTRIEIEGITHEVLAELTGSRRATITAALNRADRTRPRVVQRRSPLGPARRRRVSMSRSERAKLLALAGALLVLLLAGGAVLLLAADGGSDGEPLASVEGLVETAAPGKLVLRAHEPVNGSRRVEFAVRDEDAAEFDVAHLELHIRDELPIRVHYREEGGTLYAVEYEDL